MCQRLDTDKTPEERAKFLETTPLFANIHAKAASSGQTSVPQNLDTNLHFTCFVQAPNVEARETQTPATSMRLIELDGRRSGPVDRGECKDLLQVSRHVITILILADGDVGLLSGCCKNCEKCIHVPVCEHAFQHDVSWSSNMNWWNDVI